MGNKGHRSFVPEEEKKAEKNIAYSNLYEKKPIFRKVKNLPLEIHVAHFTPADFPLLPIVTKKSARLCELSWASILADIPTETGAPMSGITVFYNEFYSRLDLFDRNGMFDEVLSRNVSGVNKIVAKGAIITRIINYVIKIDGNTHALQSRLVELGRSHAKKHIRPHQYATFVQTLLLTISNRLGTQATNDVMEAWVNIFALVMQTMLPNAIDGMVDETELFVNSVDYKSRIRRKSIDQNNTIDMVPLELPPPPRRSILSSTVRSIQINLSGRQGGGGTAYGSTPNNNNSHRKVPSYRNASLANSNHSSSSHGYGSRDKLSLLYINNSSSNSGCKKADDAAVNVKKAKSESELLSSSTALPQFVESASRGNTNTDPSPDLGRVSSKESSRDSLMNSSPSTSKKHKSSDMLMHVGNDPLVEHDIAGSMRMKRTSITGDANLSSFRVVPLHDSKRMSGSDYLADMIDLNPPKKTVPRRDSSTSHAEEESDYF